MTTISSAPYSRIALLFNLWLLTSEEIHNSDGSENNMISFVNAPFELGTLFSDRRERERERGRERDRGERRERGGERERETEIEGEREG